MIGILDAGPEMTEEEFRLLRDLVNSFCGIDFLPEHHFALERRLRERLRALDLPTFLDYYHYLKYRSEGPAELERAAELLTTNETYFFREEFQLKAFRDEILPALYERLEAQGRRRLSVWSAGCSSGEEVYTLAMLIEHSGLFDGWDVRIFGNDISRRVLRVARSATYGSSSFRAMPKEFEGYFSRTPEGRQVVSRIRAMCHFGHLNLLDYGRTAIVGRVDVIFCRNVLIYLDAGSRRKVIDTFYERLVPGGFLLLGHSESLLNLSTAFELAHLKGDLAYRRPSLKPAAARRSRFQGNEP